MKKRIYPYAVLDGNQTVNREKPESCHLTAEAAIKAAAKQNKGNPNSNYFATEWDGARWESDFVRNYSPLTSPPTGEQI